MPVSSDNREKNRLATRDAFEVHRQMVVSLFFATLSMAILLSAGLLNLWLSMLPAVCAAGALGGFISALRRLYAFERVIPADILAAWPRKANVYIIVYSLIPPLVGAIAAVTLYVIFAAGLVQGDLFPKFSLSTIYPRCDSFWDFVYNWEPNSPAAYAKALVWGFIAGFSERFVPDILNRLGSRKNEKTKSGSA